MYSVSTLFAVVFLKASKSRNSQRTWEGLIMQAVQVCCCTRAGGRWHACGTGTREGREGEWARRGLGLRSVTGWQWDAQMGGGADVGGGWRVWQRDGTGAVQTGHRF
jgi:hypothetical protein